jgi:ABC-type Fe3+-siderophore transport system permease subunit
MHRNLFFTLIFALIALITIPLTLGFGVYDISLADSVKVFFEHLIGNVTDMRSDHFIWDVRLPRALGAVIIGAGLSVAGAIMQNDFRNPLAEPYTMGLSSGAFFGVVIIMVSGVSIIPFLTGQIALTVNAFICSLVPLGMILIVSRFRTLTPTAMILIGIAIMFLFNSISQILLISTSAETLADAYAWRVGSTSKIDWDEIPLILAITVVGIVLVWTMHKKLDVMYAGDRGAKSMGVNAGRVRIITLAIVSLMTACLVSLSGTIGFIGLVGPHIARIFVGSNNRYLIPASAAFGAAFMALADTIAKVTGPDGLPVGVISSMIGGPLFVYILIRQRKSAWA